jgi:hypothetical protein
LAGRLLVVGLLGLLLLKSSGRSTETACTGECAVYEPERRRMILWAIAAILLVLWLLGMVTFHALGLYIHILLVLAIIAVLIRIIQGRNPL